MVMLAFCKNTYICKIIPVKARFFITLYDLYK